MVPFLKVGSLLQRNSAACAQLILNMMQRCHILKAGNFSPIRFFLVFIGPNTLIAPQNAKSHTGASNDKYVTSLLLKFSGAWWLCSSFGKNYYLHDGRMEKLVLRNPLFDLDCWFRQHKASDLGEDMTLNFMVRAAILVTLSLSVGACSKGTKLFGKTEKAAEPTAVTSAPKEDKIWDMFNANSDANVTINVNKYIWNATLDVLSFLPVETIDPFTGLIVTGYGTPPGGGTAYRATVLMQDPALDARSLKLALYTRSGAAVSLETLRLVENAILTRARQMRLVDSKL